ncbi:MAG TPA: T9SS type A sorting domain-containing protein [Flavipsychrobacter sp.]|nr:T9SS type A sorting domain-containing protein [Flavipsychrobacter sp.]
MKLKISMLFGALFLAQLSYAQITDPSPYCPGGYDDGIGYVPHCISKVTLGTLSNRSGDTAFAAPHYVYYNNVTAPDLVAGNTYTLSVSHDSIYDSPHFMAAYIDFNQNNSFYDSGERVLQQTGRARSVTDPSIATITIPATATPGITRMRVMDFEDDWYTYYNVNATPCTDDTLDWGETEDYNVNIVAPTGITEIAKNNTNLFYPNPANGTMYVSESLLGSEMTIYNMEGKAIQHGTISNKTIEVVNIAPGQYIIKAINNRNVYTQPLTIIKQ